jgi:alpha-galactosidase
MDLTGFFQTESSHHASEYYPHFRRSAEDVRALLPQRWDYLEITRGNNDAELERLADDFAAGTLAVSEEYAARIVDSVLTNTPRVVYGNVPNTGLITNLPDGSCVEVPCLVDQNGVQPTFVGDLPAACAGINLASVGYQHCVVEAYLQRSKDLIYAAASLDRLTSSLLSLDQIRRMCDEMIEAQRQWLPDVR